MPAENIGKRRSQEDVLADLAAANAAREARGGELNIFRDGKIHVMAEQCDACLLSPNRLVDPSQAAEIVRKTKDLPGSAFACHKGSIAVQDAICRRWYDAFAKDDPVLMLGEAMGVIQEVTDL
jgi:hypothetical protein